MNMGSHCDNVPGNVLDRIAKVMANHRKLMNAARTLNFDCFCVFVCCLSMYQTAFIH